MYPWPVWVKVEVLIGHDEWMLIVRDSRETWWINVDSGLSKPDICTNLISDSISAYQAIHCFCQKVWILLQTSGSTISYCLKLQVPSTTKSKFHKYRATQCERTLVSWSWSMRQCGEWMDRHGTLHPPRLCRFAVSLSKTHRFSWHTIRLMSWQLHWTWWMNVDSAETHDESMLISEISNI